MTKGEKVLLETLLNDLWCAAADDCCVGSISQEFRQVVKAFGLSIDAVYAERESSCMLLQEQAD